MQFILCFREKCWAQSIEKSFIEHLLCTQTMPAPIKGEEPAFTEYVLCARHFTGAVTSTPHSIAVS